MKKHILAEVNRMREVMGLSIINEQADDIVKLIEKIAGKGAREAAELYTKLEGDLVRLGKSADEVQALIGKNANEMMSLVNTRLAGELRLSARLANDLTASLLSKPQYASDAYDIIRTDISDFDDLLGMVNRGEATMDELRAYIASGTSDETADFFMDVIAKKTTGDVASVGAKVSSDALAAAYEKEANNLKWDDINTIIDDAFDEGAATIDDVSFKLDREKIKAKIKSKVPNASDEMIDAKLDLLEKAAPKTDVELKEMVGDMAKTLKMEVDAAKATKANYYKTLKKILNYNWGTKFLTGLVLYYGFNQSTQFLLWLADQDDTALYSFIELMALETGSLQEFKDKLAGIKEELPDETQTNTTTTVTPDIAEFKNWMLTNSNPWPQEEIDRMTFKVEGDGIRWTKDDGSTGLVKKQSDGSWRN